MGCQDIRADRRLIDNPPLSLDEAVRHVKTNQLSGRALTSRSRGVHAVRYSDPSSGEETYIYLKTYIEPRHQSALGHLNIVRQVGHQQRKRRGLPERDRGVLSPVQVVVHLGHATSVTSLGTFVATVLIDQSHVLLALPLAVERVQMRST